MSKKKERVAILTSGGDAPGMNAVVRGFQRGLTKKTDIEIFGYRDGFSGLAKNKYQVLTSKNSIGTLKEAGSFLGSDRYENLKIDGGETEILKTIEKEQIQILVVIGGNGSLQGSYKLAQNGVNIIFIPASIDDDIPLTTSLGYSSARQIAVNSLDALKQTSKTMQAIHLVDVMGRHCGRLAISSALASGAEYAIVPEVDFDQEVAFRKIETSLKKAAAADVLKSHLVVVAEGYQDNGAIGLEAILPLFKKEFGGDKVKGTKLGYIQRGAPPTAYDREIGSILGSYAARLIRDGSRETIGKMITINGEEPNLQDLPYVIGLGQKPINKKLLEIVNKSTY